MTYGPEFFDDPVEIWRRSITDVFHLDKEYTLLMLSEDSYECHYVYVSTVSGKARLMSGVYGDFSKTESSYFFTPQQSYTEDRGTWEPFEKDTVEVSYFLQSGLEMDVAEKPKYIFYGETSEGIFWPEYGKTYFSEGLPTTLI